LAVRLAALLTVRLAALLTVRLDERCEERLCSVAPLEDSSFDVLLGFFGSIFLSLTSFLQVDRCVDDTQHHPRPLVCHRGDIPCVNPPTFGLDEPMSTMVDVWDTLAAAIDGRDWRPELAQWVEVKRFEARDGHVYAMVANRRDLVYYRLEEAELDLLPLLDGTRTLGELVVSQFDTSGDLDAATVIDLVRTLHSGGFLTDHYVDVDAAVTKAIAPTGLQVRLTKFARTLKIEWSGAERLTQWCYRHGLRHLFRPAGIALSALVAVGGLVAFAAEVARHGLAYETRTLGGWVALLFALNLLLIFIHELGHAAVLVHYQRRVRSAGFRIYFGAPAFFVDSSDALMLDREARIAQSFGGPYFELIASGLAAIALWLWPHGFMAPLLFSFVVVNYYVLLINLTPMLELDGYFMLSDAIRVPDLRPRSLSFVRRDLWTKLRHRERFSSVDVGLLVFGTVGVAFTVFVLVSSFWFWQRTFGGLIAALWHAGAAGIVALAVLVSFLAAPIIRGLVVLVRAVARRLETLLQRSRFRMQRHWRIEAAALIDALPLFEDLPVDILNDIAGRVERRHFGAGSTVVRQGDPATAMYVVRSGILDVIEEDADGSQRVVQTLSAGESFGVIGLVSGAPRNATVRTRRRAVLVTIDKGTFDRLLTDHVALPEFAPTLYELAALRALPPFANVPSEELLRLREHGSWLNVPPGTPVVEQGAVGDAFFAVGDGQFEVVVDGQRVGTCEPGGHFGELALLSDAPRAATVRSITPARVFRLDRAGFEQLVAGAFRDRVDAATHRVAFQRE
jgi:putative peptide zinc metalloprotease protein